MKKFFFILFIYAVLTNLLHAEVVKKISIEGNNRVADSTIVSFAQIKIGDDVDSKKLNNVLKNLYSTNFFEDIKVNIDANILSITVVENPVVQTIEFKGIKKKSVVEVLRQNTKLKEKSSYLKNKVRDDEKIILNILKSNGYYFAEIQSKVKINDDYNTVDLIYDITLGDKAFIKKIKFIGDKKIKDGKLRKIIVSEEAKFWKFISNKKFLDISRIKLDEKLLANYYKNKGYYKVTVESSSAKIINESDFELIFNINAGKKYYFKKLDLVITNDYPKENFVEIFNLFEKFNNTIYSLNKIDKILTKIDKIALNKNFEFVDIRYDEKIVEGNKINLSFLVDESKKLYVERINVFGNNITNEKVIRNSLIVDEGDALNNILLNKSVNQLKSRNLFKTVKSDILDGNSDDKKIVNITVEEKPTGEIFAGAGTGTAGSTVSVGISENNYLGQGVGVTTNLSISEESVQGVLSIKNPNYRNSDRSLNTRIESQSTDYLSKFGYKTSKTGFSFGTSFEQYEDLYFSPQISTYYEDVETSAKASAAKKKQEGDYFDSEFTYGLTLNRLNQNYQPTSGFKSKFIQTLPMYSEDWTVRNSYEFSKYLSTNNDTVFAFNFFVKAVNALSSDDVRITKRVFIPGKKLRGFEIGKIGPIDNGDFIGGNYGTSLNFAASMPTIAKDLENLDINFFIDAANVWGVDYDSSLDNSKVRSSTGIALDWFTPVGPLNFSFALPISKADTDKTETFRFNIGTSF